MGPKHLPRRRRPRGFSARSRGRRQTRRPLSARGSRSAGRTPVFGLCLGFVCVWFGVGCVWCETTLGKGDTKQHHTINSRPRQSQTKQNEGPEKKTKGRRYLVQRLGHDLVLDRHDERREHVVLGLMWGWLGWSGRRGRLDAMCVGLSRAQQSREGARGSAISPRPRPPPSLQAPSKHLGLHRHVELLHAHRQVAGNLLAVLARARVFWVGIGREREREGRVRVWGVTSYSFLV
jgi:hypothetical protein